MKRNYARIIEEMRTTHGLNLVAIGQRMGIDPRTVGKWAKGKHKPNEKSRKRLNQLYREVKQDMTKQASIFEEITDQGPLLQVITTAIFHGKALDIYGDFDNPIFKVVDVARTIGYSNTGLDRFFKTLDEDEKDKKEILTTGGVVYQARVITEQGLYEILSKLRRPKAEEFKKWVKQVLKDIRKQDYYKADTLAEAERYYIDTLAKAIADAQNMDEKNRLTSKLTRFMQEL